MKRSKKGFFFFKGGIVAFANIPYYGKRRHFRNAIAPFCLLLGQLLLAIDITDALLLVRLACACLALPLLQSQPHLWLAAPLSLLLQTQNTKSFALLSPHKSRTTPCLSSRAARLGCSRAWVGTSCRICLHSLCSSLHL